MNRRHFIRQCGLAAGALAGTGSLLVPGLADAASSGMRLGLVTYLWGKDMDLETLISSCERSGLLGVEARTRHAHGIEPSLSKTGRADVRKRFADSPVTLIGYGSNAEFHSPDPAKLKHNIELAKDYIRLMHDCGGSGVKVKPNALPAEIPREKTIEQIGRALNKIAAYGDGFGQQIRVEVHGRDTSELPVMKAIFDVADHPNARVCWNSNGEDLHGEGLEHNFNLVKERFGDTCHVREFNVGDYPYQQLMDLFKAANYKGWILLEARTDPADKVAAMIEQRKLFEKMVGA